MINTGQVCNCAERVYVQREVHDDLVARLKQLFEATRYGDPSAEADLDMGPLVNQAGLDKVAQAVERAREQGATIVTGGRRADLPEGFHYLPTLITGAPAEMDIMRREPFGPVLPVQPVDSLDEAIARIQERPKPLALYLFTRAAAPEKRVLGEVSFGGGCVNDTVLHLATSYMPFGGVGESGMGGYHGKYSFDTFSHEKSVLKRLSWPDVALRYAPYWQKLKQLKRLM